MYFPYFIIYITLGLVLSVVVFVWAHKNGQLKDQQRARFLPLEDGPKSSALRPSRVSRLEIYGLFILASAGLAASAAILIFSIIFAK
jgi:nitrogen fixation-related uncharacterized protein